MMETLDFSRSFVTFVTPGRGNNARIQVECRCTLTAPGEASRSYLVVASCKAEDTYAADDLFRVPNYDFCGIFGPDEYAIIRVHATADEGGYEIADTTPRFDEVNVRLTAATGQVLADPHETVVATLAGRPLVARTELSDPDSGFQAQLEYPVKTMNVNDLQWLYQVDTGPVVFPDLQGAPARPIERLTLAFVAFNRPDQAEFILQVLTPAANGAIVRHYSEVRKAAARNAILALD
jgi:hypothetical protein